MISEYVNEMFRSETGRFYENFAEYLINKRTNRWNVKNCTFFHDEDKNKTWAWCLFERKG